MDNSSRTDPASQPAVDALQDQSRPRPGGDRQQETTLPRQDTGTHPEQSADQPTEDTQPGLPGAETAATKKKKDKKDKKPGSNRGVETLFRVNYNNHIQLSQLADGKANMLISINGLIISILIALIGPRFNYMTWTLLPVLILLVGCLTSLAFAVVASRPRLNQTPVTLDQVRSNKGNILFFGIFTKLSLTEFEQGMQELLRDRQLVYDNMTRDLYSMGKVLRKKYYYLQFAYAAFLMTLVIAVAAFLSIFFHIGI